MSAALTVLGLVLSGVLGWSGVAKLREPDSTAAAMRQLRVPFPLAGRAVQVAVPWVELGLAMALLVFGGWWLRLGWLAGVLLFACYLGLVAAALRRGSDVDCNCFGSGSAPVDRWTLARNLLLVSAGVLGLIGSFQDSRPLVARGIGAPGQYWVSLGVSLVVVALVAVLVWAQRPRLAPAEAPEQNSVDSELAGDDDYVRQPIPASVVEREPGRPMMLASLAAQRAVLLLSVSVTCGSCAAVLDRVPDYIDRLPALDIVLLMSDRGLAAGLPEQIRDRVAVDVAQSTSTALQLRYVPSAVILGVDGLLAGGPVQGADEVMELVEDVIAQFDEAELTPRQ